MDKTKRAVRRAHTERLKAKRRVYWNAGYWAVKYTGEPVCPRRVGITYRTPKACGCWMCSNHRTLWGPSIAEVKQKARWLD